MTRWQKFLRSPARDQCLLLESAALLATVQAGLWLLPFRTLRHLLTRISCMSVRRPQAAHGSIGEVVAAVDVVSRHFPRFTTCLTQALAAQTLLRRRGYVAELRIGVTRGHGGLLQAHAWVESAGRVVFGGNEGLARYVPLSPLEGKGR